VVGEIFFERQVVGEIKKIQKREAFRDNYCKTSICNETASSLQKKK
jgi:hypothetical protein